MVGGCGVSEKEHGEHGLGFAAWVVEVPLDGLEGMSAVLISEAVCVLAGLWAEASSWLVVLAGTMNVVSRSTPWGKAGQDPCDGKCS